MVINQRSEPEEAFEEELDPFNQLLLDKRKENDSPVVSQYASVEKLGMFDTAGLVINRMIGSGIFSTPGTILIGTGSVGVAMMFWITGAFIAFAGLCVYLELGLTIPRRRIGEGANRRDVFVPRSGGEKNYLEWIYKKPRYAASCVYAVVFVFLGNTAANSIVFSRYTLECFNNDNPSNWVVKAYALTAVTVACMLHGVWRSGGIWISNLLAIFKVVVLFFIIGLGFAVRGGAFPNINRDIGNFDTKTSFANPATKPYGLVMALLSVRFSYGGFENANYVLSDIKKPERYLKKSTMFSLALVSFLYIFTNIAYLFVVPRDEAIASGTRMAALFFDKIFGENTTATRVFPALCALSSFGNLVAVTFVAAKVKQEIAKEGVLPLSKFWSRQYKFSLSRSERVERSHDAAPIPRVGETPIPALMLHWVISVLLVMIPPSGDAYTLLSNLYAYSIEACIGVLLAAGLLYKRYNKDGHKWKELRGFTPWLGPIIPIFYLLANIVMVCVPWMHSGESIVMKSIPWFVFPTAALSVFAGGFVYWAVFRFAVPAVSSKVLHVKRIPYFDRDVFVLEAVYSKWVSSLIHVWHSGIC
ncbi:amino acid permease-domain-containing protein [Pyronema omphalodes]|nr:amino acid permease-domain-containing protein [Pyronema omphalodes]